MRGYVLHEKGRADWAEVPAPPLGPYDALTRPTAVATCTSDVNLIATAGMPTLIGKVIGHEGVGIVEQVGDLVTDFKPGDRVVLPTGHSNWRHPRAQRGEAKYFQIDNPYVSTDPAIGGTFAELVLTRDADPNLAHIPDEVTDVQAVLVSDMIGTGFTGIERMQIEFGETVVVIGIGPVGLMGVAGAALKGAGRIIAVGSRPGTMVLARQYGATDILDYKHGPITEQVFGLTGGETVDSVLIASGGDASDIFTTALRIVKPGGHVANVSGFLDNETVTVPMDVWQYGFMERFITCVTCKDGRDFVERILRLIQVGRLDPTPLATPVLAGWDHLAEGFELMRSRDQSVIKPVVVT